MESQEIENPYEIPTLNIGEEKGAQKESQGSQDEQKFNFQNPVVKKETKPKSILKKTSSVANVQENDEPLFLPSDQEILTPTQSKKEANASKENEGNDDVKDTKSTSQFLDSLEEPVMDSLDETKEQNGKQNTSSGKPNDEEEDWKSSPEEPMPDFTPIVLSGPSIDVNSVLSEKSPNSALKLHFTQTQFTQAPEKASLDGEKVSNGTSLACEEKIDSQTPPNKKPSQENGASKKADLALESSIYSPPSSPMRDDEPQVNDTEAIEDKKESEKNKNVEKKQMEENKTDENENKREIESIVESIQREKQMKEKNIAEDELKQDEEKLPEIKKKKRTIQIELKESSSEAEQEKKEDKDEDVKEIPAQESTAWTSKKTHKPIKENKEKTSVVFDRNAKAAKEPKNKFEFVKIFSDKYRKKIESKKQAITEFEPADEVEDSREKSEPSRKERKKKIPKKKEEKMKEEWEKTVKHRKQEKEEDEKKEIEDKEDEDEDIEEKTPKKIKKDSKSSKKKKEPRKKRIREISESESSEEEKIKETRPKKKTKKEEDKEEEEEDMEVEETKISKEETSNAEEDVDPKSEEIEYAEGDMCDKYPKQEPAREKDKRQKHVMFKGIHFLITGLIDGISSKIRNAITECGGFVIKEIKWESPDSFIKKGSIGGFPATILISDQPKRTPKFLSALAAGVPCLHYNWILHSVESALLPYRKYMLPNGYSKIKKSLITRDNKEESEDEETEIFSISKHRIEVLPSVITSEFKVFVAMDILTFKPAWTKILRDAGAKVVERLFRDNEESLYCILSDIEPDEAYIKRAKTLGIPVVSPEWAIQSLIVGKPVAFDADPQFRFDHKDNKKKNSLQSPARKMK